MNLFSISQLSQFSGIKPHTIRIWEQRYSALKPNRSEGNTRYYDGIQLRRLLNIVSLMNNGLKVSQLCSMTDDKLFSLVFDYHKSDLSESAEYYVSQLISAGMSYDEAHFEKVFSQCLRNFGMKKAYIRVIYPLLLRIGLMWASNIIPTTQEHFISNIIRQKLSASIDSLPGADLLSDSWLLFLPENEFHEIGLLFAHYILRFSARKVIYLGSNVPIESVFSAIRETKPHNLLLFLVHHDLPVLIQENLDQLNVYFTGKKIYVAGNKKLISQIKSSGKIQCLQTIESLEQILQFNEV